MASATDTLQVTGIRCERCVMPARGRARGPARARGGQREPDGRGHADVGRRGDVPRGARRDARRRRLPRAPDRLTAEAVGNSHVPAAVHLPVTLIRCPGGRAGDGRVGWSASGRDGSSRPGPLRGGGARARRPGLPGRATVRLNPRGSRGSGAGHVREGVQELAVLHAGHEPPRVAPADPHEPQRRSRPASSSGGPTRHRSRRATTTSRTAWPRRAASRCSTRSASSSGSRRTRS